MRNFPIGPVGLVLARSSILVFPASKKETVTGRQSGQTGIVKSYKENSILASNRLLDYSDIDRTTEDFLEYFQQDFMPSLDLTSLKNKRLTRIY